MWPTTRHSAYPFLNSGIKGFIGLTEQLEQVLMVLIEVEDKLLTVGQDEQMNADEILKHLACSGVLNRFAGLMGKSLSLGLQAFADMMFQGRID
jgi:hypothetical protein